MKKSEPAPLPAPAYSFDATSTFSKAYKALKKKYPSMAADLAALKDTLFEAPQSGTPLGRDCYKIRMAISSKKAGKRGGARVVACVKIVREKIYLLTVFDKGQQESVTDKELEAMLKEAGLE